MAAVFRKQSDSVQYKNTTSSEITSGAFVQIGDMVGIVRNGIPAGETGTVFLDGDYSDVDKYASASGAALEAGKLVYLNTTNGKIYNATASGYLCIGVAAEDATTTATKCRIFLNFYPSWNAFVSSAITTHAALTAGTSAGNVHPGPST